MRYLLDTNVISEIAKPQPAVAIADWLGRRSAADLFVASFTLAEIWRGIMELAPGRRRDALRRWFAGPDGPPALFRDRVLPFAEEAALEWGRIVAEGSRIGRPRSPLDMIIAATAAANQCIVVTANDRHFRDVIEFINPMRAR